MRVLTVSRIRTWLLAGMERLWSQLAPRRQAGEIVSVAVDAIRRQRELVLENAVLRHQVNDYVVAVVSSTDLPHPGKWTEHRSGCRSLPSRYGRT